MLQNLQLFGFTNSEGTTQDIHFTYQTLGPELGTAPVVLVLHALSGNSEVVGSKGWWNELIGIEKAIDTGVYTVLALDMPGNGFNGKQEHLLQNYKDFTLKDFAKIYIEAFQKLKIEVFFAGIGGSIGGALLWEIAALVPDLFQNIIPVATDYKSTEWVKALCKVQDQILNNSLEPLKDARMHAMTFYRSPESFKEKFSNSEPHRGVENWLEYHGSKLEQ
ncbi:MAG: alpha/beta fold hydrolase, partial [Gillisia sp.]